MNILKSILNFSTEKVNSYGAQYDAFWIFMLVFYITPPYAWVYWHPGSYPNSWILALRIFSFFLGFAIALRRIWPAHLKIYLPLFWHFTLFFWCPFRTVFTLLNSSHSKVLSSYGILGIFLFAVLVDEISYTIILLLGLIITPLFFYATGGLATDFPNSEAIYQTIWMIITITAFKWGFFRQQRLYALEKIKCYQNVASIVAHEMRVPLASILLTTKGINRIEQANFVEVKKIQQRIEKLASQGQTTIDMLLFRLGKSISKEKFTMCSLSECLEEALVEYPFEKGEREKIEIENNGDVVFFGNRRFIIHVFFNLIKNALFAIKKAKKGHIFISFDNRKNQLRFKDTANGISSKELKNLFKEFYTTKSNGTGMGLFFCKQTMASLDGNITCSSEENHFTEFMLNFPRHKRGQA